LTHALLQFVSGGPESVAHVNTQVPFRQLGVAAVHALPQLPQFLGSVLMLMQAAPQMANGEQFKPSGRIASVIGGPSLRGASPTVPSTTLPSGRTRPSIDASPGTIPSRDTPSVVESLRKDPSPVRLMSNSVRPHPSATAASTQITKNA
jgi:hypothetical protein